MSLQVWLPLNGSLENQGLKGENPSLMGSGITYTAGKIGQAATFPNNCNSCIHMPGLRLQTGTFASWILIKGAGATSRQCIISEGRDSYNDGVEIYASQAGTTIYFKAHEKVLSTTIELNKWYHISGVFGDGQIKLYLNGNLINTTTYTTDMTYQYASDLVFGKMSYSYTNTSNYFPFNGQLNDVRIYDHALSDKEIEEIAKGLVLHYKLDNNGLGGENLATNTSFPTSNIQGYNNQNAIEYNHNDWTSGGRFFSNYSNSRLTFTEIKANQPYTISAWVYIYDDVTLSRPDNTSIFYRIYKTGESPTYSYDISVTLKGITQRNQWIKISNTFTSSVTYTYNQGGTFQIGGYNGHFLVSMPKIELGSVATPWSPNPADLDIDSSIIYDSSGYGNNGILNSNLLINTDTPRYFASSYFGNYETPKITLQDPSILTNLTNCTVCWWGKYDTTKTLLLTGQSGSFYLAASDNNTFYHGSSGSPIMYKNGINGTYKCVANSWDFYVLKNVDLSTWTTMKINGYSAGWPLKGLISDFRIYATALTADQILELYHTSGSIDNNGNIYARELVEE